MREWATVDGLPSTLAEKHAMQRKNVLGAYAALSGRADLGAPPRAGPYGEAEIAQRATRAWPFTAGDAVTVGAVMAGTGFVLAACRARVGHRVFEVGATTGHFAILLARLGCAVTAQVDAPLDAAVLRRQVDRGEIPLTVREAGATVDTQRFDFVLSHGSFARQLEHPAFLVEARDRLLAPGGRLLLVAEPLDENLAEPWMLDPSLTQAAAQDGSFALAYRPSYLLDVLDILGFDATLLVCPYSPHGNMIMAARRPAPQGMQ